MGGCRGVVSEWSKERDWKSRTRLIPGRGFESHPLRHPFENEKATPPTGGVSFRLSVFRLSGQAESSEI